MTDPLYPQVPPTPPTEYVSPWAPPDTTVVELQAVPPGRGPRVLAVAAGILAVVGGGVFAVRALGSGGGGASSPEAAAEALVDAINDEDVLGLVDLLPAGERELLRDVLTGASDEYRRLGVLSEDFRLDGFRGVDITITDATFDVDVLTDGDGASDGLAVAAVVGGEVAAAVDGDELLGNLGRVVEDVADERDVDLDVDDAEEEVDVEDAGLQFAIVEEGGRWYPSVAFTIAELARARSFDEDLDVPDLDGGVVPRGADSPEDAVQALLDAGVELDAEAAIALLDPGEARALHVYSQFFLPLDDAVDEDVEITAELTSAEVDDLGGGAHRVVPTGLEVRFTDGEGTGEVVLEDGCVRVDIQPPPDEGDPIDEEVCTTGEAGEVPAEIGDVEVPDAVRDALEAFLPVRIGVVTMERDGEHFIAPVRTLADAVLGLTRGLEPEDLEEGGAVYEILAGEHDDEIEAFVEELFEEALFGDFEEGFDEGFEDVGEPIEEECEGAGCGFDDDGATPSREPTGPSGTAGELFPFDVVEGSVAQDGVATFTAIADIDGDYLIGAEGAGGFDGVVAVTDAATGELLAENDDFGGSRDPEVLVTLAAGQTVTVEVRGFAGMPGDFLVYFEDF